MIKGKTAINVHVQKYLRRVVPKMTILTVKYKTEDRPVDTNSSSELISAIRLLFLCKTILKHQLFSILRYRFCNKHRTVQIVDIMKFIVGKATIKYGSCEMNVKRFLIEFYITQLCLIGHLLLRL